MTTTLKEKRKGTGEIVAKNGHGKPAEAQERKEMKVAISAPNFKTLSFPIIGTAAYVQNAFSHKAKETIKAKQELGGQADKMGKKNREAKDFKRCFEDSQHVSVEGWHGVPAPAFRNAMIAACRLVNFKMTDAKQSIFIEADGVDRHDGTPLVRISKGKPEQHVATVRLPSGVPDIRARAMFPEGWQATVRVRYDADIFDPQSVANLLHRAGLQVGIGEGRPASKSSNGMGWGTFTLA